jgi:dATP pyrophosphohydrolase
LSFKRPESVLVAVHTAEGETLLLKRTDLPDFWQSVTGALRWDETPVQAAVRELREETGIEAAPDELRDRRRSFEFPILPQFRHRYAPDAETNLEHVFSLLLPGRVPVRISAAEHSDFAWLPLPEAAVRVWSWTNRAVIESLAHW